MKKPRFQTGDFVKFYQGYGTIVDFAVMKCGLPWVKVWDEVHPIVLFEFDRMGRKVKQKTKHLHKTRLTLSDREQIEKFNP